MNEGLCWRSFEVLIELGELRQYLDGLRSHDARVRAWPEAPVGVRPAAPRLRLSLAVSRLTVPEAAPAPITHVVPIRRVAPANDLFALLTRLAEGAGR
jgi:hypothetical protein